MKKRLLVGLTGAVLLFSGCAMNNQPAPTNNENQCVIDNTNAPYWVCNPEVEGAIAAVGSAPYTPLGMSFQRTEAAAAARDALARQISVKVKNMFKQYQSTTGVGDDMTVEKVAQNVSKQVASVTLQNSKIMKVWSSKDKTLYVLVAVPKDTLVKKVKSAIKTTFKNDKALWQEFKSKKAQEELDREVEKEFSK